MIFAFDYKKINNWHIIIMIFSAIESIKNIWKHVYF